MSITSTQASGISAIRCLTSKGGPGSDDVNSYHPNLTKEDIDELIAPCIYSTPVTAVTLFQHHITRPFCAVHDQIFILVDDDTKRLVAIAAPRGFGKTTTIGLAFISRKALFRFTPYIVYISATHKEAAKKVKKLAFELQYNQLLRELFGDLKGIKWAEEAGEIELVDENGKPFCFIQARGAGSQVRGLTWNEHRPGLFIVDDLEDKEESRNEKIRQDLTEWFFGDLMGAMDNADLSESRLIVIGTIVHQDSVLANLIEEKNSIIAKDLDLDEEAQKILEAKEKFHCIRLEACNDNYESIWPEFISTAAIRAKAAAYRARGLLNIFFMEFRNMVIATEASPFQEGMFRHYDEFSTELKSELQKGNCDTVIIVDPAKTVNPKSANTAIIAVGFNSSVNKIFFRDCVNDKLDPDETFKEACDMADRFQTHIIGFEVTGLNNYATYPFQQYINTRNKYYELIEIKANKAKEERIKALKPFYKMGVIWHNVQIHIRGALESQLLSFPYSKLWDVMDAFAHMIKMFDLGERHFSFIPEDLENYKTVQDEYAELEKEDKDEAEEDKLTNWRIV